MATHTDTEDFNYTAAKIVYLQLLKEELARENNPEDSLKLDKTIENLSRTEDSQPLGECQDLGQKNNVYNLFINGKYRDVMGTNMMSYEDIFDIFMRVHIREGHASHNQLLKRCEDYICPNFCLELIIKSCNYCMNGSILPGQICILYVITVMQQKLDERFHYLLIYIDKATNYIMLRPMVAKTVAEIALTLFQIFSQCGPPKKIHMHGYDPDFTNDVDKYVKKLCPMFNVSFKHESMVFDLPTLITDKLDEWRKSSRSDLWELGCSVVQMNLNNRIGRSPMDNDIFSTPNKLFYNKLSDTNEQV